MCTYVCTYVHIYIYIYTYIHTYIHTYTHIRPGHPLRRQVGSVRLRPRGRAQRHPPRPVLIIFKS